jgi:hypothetical protein
VSERAHQSARAGAPDGSRAAPASTPRRAGRTASAGHELVGVARRHDLAGELETALGGGLPLPDPRRDELERRLGVGLRAVRLHRGPRADALADALGATAFTTGDDVFVHRTAPELATSAGRHLLAHEVFHVIQQRRGPVEGAPGPGGLFVSHPSDRHERAAASAAEQIAQGSRVDLGATAGASGPARSGSAVQRQTPMEIATDVAPVLPAAATVGRGVIWWALLPSEIAALEAGAAVPVAGTTAALVTNPVGWIVLGTVVVVGVGVAVYLVVRALQTPAENQPLSGHRPKEGMALHQSPPPTPAPVALAPPTRGTGKGSMAPINEPLQAPGVAEGTPVLEPESAAPVSAPGDGGMAPVREPEAVAPALAPGAAEAAEPLQAAFPPEVAAALAAKLQPLRPDGKRLSEYDVRQIVNVLGKTPGGAAIAAHILLGAFDACQGYFQLLSNCKAPGMVPSTLMAFERASQILGGDPKVILRFEDSDKRPLPEGHDVDLGIVDPSGDYSVIWQFGSVSGSGKIATNAFGGGDQLVNVQASRKVVELQVRPKTTPEERGGAQVIDDGSSIFFDKYGFDRGLEAWRVRHPDVELHITFTDGVVRTY